MRFPVTSYVKTTTLFCSQFCSPRIPGGLARRFSTRCYRVVVAVQERPEGSDFEDVAGPDVPAGPLTRLTVDTVRWEAQLGYWSEHHGVASRAWWSWGRWACYQMALGRKCECFCKHGSLHSLLEPSPGSRTVPLLLYSTGGSSPRLPVFKAQIPRWRKWRCHTVKSTWGGGQSHLWKIQLVMPQLMRQEFHLLKPLTVYLYFPNRYFHH